MVYCLAGGVIGPGGHVVTDFYQVTRQYKLSCGVLIRPTATEHIHNMPGGSSKEQRSMCVCMYTNSLLLIQKVDIYQNIWPLLKHMIPGYEKFFYCF